jgi:hypothetical protein
MSSSASPDIVTNGLVLCLDAADKKSYPGSGATWFDRSGNGNNGTLIGGVGYNSGNGGSIVVDGVDDYISSLTLSTLSATDITIQLWIYPTNIGSGNTYITVFDTPNRHLSLWIGNNFYGLGGASAPSYAPFNWQNNNWTCITMFKSANTGQIIKNNYEVFENISSGSTLTNQVQFGSNPSSGGTYFAGRYGSIRLYNRTLSPQEIKQNFNATKSRFGLL